MSTPSIEYISAAQERALASLRQSQSAVVDAVGAWAKSLEQAAAELPSIPVLKGVPSAEEIIENSFDFYSELLTAQREFARELVTGMKPVIKTTPVEAPSKK
jgi:hypothetical protein